MILYAIYRKNKTAVLEKQKIPAENNVNIVKLSEIVITEISNPTNDQQNIKKGNEIKDPSFGDQVIMNLDKKIPLVAVEGKLITVAA